MACVISDLGNGIILRANGRTYRLDPRRAVAGDFNLVSHAHSDHLPSAVGNASIVCSSATHDLMRLHRKKIHRADESSITIKDAGHTPDSSMFVVEGHPRIMYTGDFCTRRKRHIHPALPHNCDILVMESTYGKPEYKFPDHGDTIGAIRDWVDTIIGSGATAVLFAYPLGKAQELCFELSGFPLRMQKAIADRNRVLAAHGYRLPMGCSEGMGGDQEPFVYLTSGLGAEREKVKRMLSDGAKAASFSGWSVRRLGGRGAGSRAEMFPLSDHCDFNELMEFARRCNPTKVLTTHGFAADFAESVRRELGIDAEPLIRGQESLDRYL